MNLLIAIMSDAYAQIQENAKAADSRSLADMEKELEQLVYFFASLYRPERSKDDYEFLFFTKKMKESEVEVADQMQEIVQDLKNTFEERFQKLEDIIT